MVIATTELQSIALTRIIAFVIRYWAADIIWEKFGAVTPILVDVSVILEDCVVVGDVCCYEWGRMRWGASFAVLQTCVNVDLVPAIPGVSLYMVCAVIRARVVASRVLIVCVSSGD